MITRSSLCNDGTFSEAELNGKKISLLGFGAMRLPTLKGGAIDINHVVEMIDLAMKSGVNYYDTAYPYHGQKSEGALKKALVERYPRTSYFLADKMPTWMVRSEDDLEKFFGEQLQRCGVDYFDFYMLHALDRYRIKDMEKHGSFKFLEKLKNDGRVKYAGFSFHDSADILDNILNDHPGVDFVQLQINYLDWDNVHARDWYDVARKHGTPIIIMEPVKGGSLANLPQDVEVLLKNMLPDKSAASWAIRFAAGLDGILTVLSGMSSIEQVEDNISTMDDFKPLSPEEHNLLGKVLEELGKVSDVPCTTCKYCVDECPQGIEIPAIFTIYNEYKRSNNSFHANMMYHGLPADSRSDKCISCGACTAHCPQKIDIPERLKQVAGELK